MRARLRRWRARLRRSRRVFAISIDGELKHGS